MELTLKIEPAVAQTGITLALVALALLWNSRTKLLSRMFPKAQPARSRKPRP